MVMRDFIGANDILLRIIKHSFSRYIGRPGQNWVVKDKSS